jgi:hypothetical protein
LLKLAQNYYQNCTLVDIGSKSVSSVELDILLNARLLLIAYDCDFNFEPCFKNGLKAHWALVTGFVLPIESSKLDTIRLSADTSSSSNQDEPSQGLIDLNKISINYNKLLELYRDDYLDRKVGQENKQLASLIHVVCRQGKSKYYGLWEFGRLLDSNRQLRDIEQERCDDGLYIRPQNGNLQQTLASKIIVIN